MTPDEAFERLQAPDAACRVPRATYRLQLSPSLTFDDAARLLPYLQSLGISDCYTSPFFETASAGSHGYDVADHNRLRDELGGEAAFRRFAAALRAHGMGLLIDLVPNHMGIAHNRNAWWYDVLENGASSPYASFFDIDWHPVKRELDNKVLLPILGDQYGVVLDSGQLRLELAGGAFKVCYHETQLPVAPRTFNRILTHRLQELQARLGPEHPELVELKSITSWFASVPPRTATDAARIAARHREIAIGKQRLWELQRRSADVRDFLEENVRIFNGTPGDPRTFDLLDGLLGDQVYRLAFWRVAGEEINYRRFFDINDLAAIRMEDPAVFAETHRLVLRLLREGIVTGLRVDHPDGLYAPAQYFRRLQRACFLESARRMAGGGADDGGWRDGDLLARYDAAVAAGRAPRAACYIVAEKILAVDERVPDRWAVAGTTGYDFLTLLNGIFVDRTQARAVDDLYARLIHGRPSFADIVYEAKGLIMDTTMSSELNVLAHHLNVISEKHRSSRDFTLASLRRALRQIVASFPTYRTYVGDAGVPADDLASLRVDETDREAIARAVALAKSRSPGMNLSVFDWISDILTLRFPAWASEADRRTRLDFAMRFQQFTGPVTAKGHEDTALYRYNRLVSLNDVGGEPGRFGTSLAEFHAAMAERRARTPDALSATSTHDTKRSEDVRARIDVLSEIPQEWRQRVARWQRLNRKHKSMVDGRPVPGPNEEYLLYQTLVGAWPISRQRLGDYMRKAMHEAKVYTSWVNPSSRYDEAIVAFAEAVLDPGRSQDFLADFVPFQARVAHFGAYNSLAQVVIKVAAPGVPDFYQGTEVWTFTLVDPDNRRPVDFAALQEMLEGLRRRLESEDSPGALAAELLKNEAGGRVKMYVTHRALELRRHRAPLFAEGDYRPLAAEGPLADHVCAFARTGAGSAVMAVTPRLLARRGGTRAPVGADYWLDTRLAVPDDLARSFRNVFTGEEVAPAAGGMVAVADVLATFPVALLEERG